MFRELLHAALDLVFPPRRVCPLCGGGDPEAVVCSGCRELLAGYAKERMCPCCGSAGPRGLGVNLVHPVQPVLCPDCRSGRLFELARAVGPYEEPLREAVHQLKYYRARWLARPMAALMAETFQSEAAYFRTRGLVPVPLHPAREQWRGFNQSVLLARALGEITGLPVLERVVARIRETPPQTGLARYERLRNLEQAFRVQKPEQITGKIITIVDDVFTTGSTVSILSHQLRQAGATGVMVLTFAIARQTGKG